MAWRCFELHYATAFSYRVPQLAKLCSPLPGPSAIRLALVGAARERAKQTGADEMRAGQELLSLVNTCPVAVEMPERVVMTATTIRRLVPQRKPGKQDIDIRRDALPREYAFPSGPFRIWLEVDDRAWEEVRSVLPWLRALGTRESLCCAIPLDGAGEVPWHLVACPDLDVSGSGTRLELTDLKPRLNLQELQERESKPYQTVPWRLPGQIQVLDESTRQFVRQPGPRGVSA